MVAGHSDAVVKADAEGGAGRFNGVVALKGKKRGMGNGNHVAAWVGVSGWYNRILHHKVVGMIYFSISISRETLDFPVQHPVWPWPHTVPRM